MIRGNSTYDVYDASEYPGKVVASVSDLELARKLAMTMARFLLSSGQSEYPSVGVWRNAPKGSGELLWSYMVGTVGLDAVIPSFGGNDIVEFAP